MFQNTTPQKPQNEFEAIILAGGRGLRLSPLTDSCPKPLLKIRGKQILEYIVSEIRLSGVSDVTIATRYLKDQISGCFADRYQCVEANFETMIDSFIYVASKSIKDYLLCLSADTLITKNSMIHTIERHLETESDITITLSRTNKSKKRWRYITDENGFLQELNIGAPNNNLERSGLVMNRQIIDSLKDYISQNPNYGQFDSGWNLIFKMMLDQDKKIYVSKQNFPVFNINTKDDLEEAKSFVLENLT
ncbi:MAG: NDP-sugar synthase [Nanoarchaeota archaeon]|nr:NDP-sugar synthase [Nanoarchaeota archaeon]